jgi:nuclear pore complex protein Nup107
VIYAALAPSLQTSAVLESACRTWEDHVWALVSVLCEEKQTTEMSKLGGGWWEGGVAAVEKGAPEVPEETVRREEQEWEKEVIEALKNRKTVRVEEGCV